MTLQERAKIGMELLTKQEPVTIEMARTQAKWIKECSSSNVKKKGINKPHNNE